MKRNVTVIIIFLLCHFAATSQTFSIANEKMNVMYLGVDNPLSFAAEKIPYKEIIVKSSNGSVIKVSGYYSARPDHIGIAYISLYHKTGGKLKVIGEKPFRVKMLPNPVFKIGSGSKLPQKKDIAAQQWVRADLENIDIDLKINIEQFSMQVLFKDSAYVTIINKGNRLSDDIRHALSLLEPGDTILFSEIYANAPWAKHLHLDDVIIKIAPESITDPSKE